MINCTVSEGGWEAALQRGLSQVNMSSGFHSFSLLSDIGDWIQGLLHLHPQSFKRFLLCVRLLCLHVSMCSMRTSGALLIRGEEKEVEDP